ncbi:sterol desaturase family protein [Chitinophaga sp. Cy-1792]|nr:sterol desaturase family protein [Chitinophaga sp. Cy-1792]
MFTVISVVIMFTPVKGYTQLYTNINDYPIWYIFVSLALSLVVHDTYFYWMHRTLHHKSLFNLTHLVHHRSTNPSPWTSYSFHLLEAIAEGGVLLVITMIMPMHPLTVLLFTVVGFMINVYGHLGYEIMPRKFRHSVLFEVFNSSVHHNLHHSKFKGNYGLYFRVWDRLMGTEHPDYVKEYDKIQARRFPEEAVAGGVTN